MFEATSERALAAPPWRSTLRFAILIVTIALILVALVLPTFLAGDALSLAVGDVAPQDIRAPVAINYQSQVLTSQRQDAVANAVSPVYNPPDTNIARGQVERLRNVLTYLSSVRADSFASFEQKMIDLAAMEDIQLTQETAERLLTTSEARLQIIQQESIVVLEQVMRNTIRDTQLEDARRQVPALVSLSIPVEQAAVISELVSAFVAPNSLYNEALTEAAREQAREAVQPVVRSFVPGETILERGRLVNEADLEALDRFGMLQSTVRWQDWASALVLVIVLTAFTVLYLRIQPRLGRDLRNLVVLAGLILVFLYGARLTIPGHTVLPYIYPLPAFSLVVAVLFGTRYALFLSLPLSVLVSYGLPGDLGLTLYYLLSSLVGVMLLGQAQRITNYIWAGVTISVTAAATVLVFSLPDPNMDLVGIATLTGAGLFIGVASASLAVLVQFLLAQILGLTTALQLMEISRPDNPLLQFILRNAPGTYQHSLQVANLAEQAAEAIGADALLTRVGALYHDAGKALNPFFFIENQPTGFSNPHDELDPYESAEIIIRHVEDGVGLARKYRLPPRVLDFIREHHGTLVTRYQFANAVNAEKGDSSQVDLQKFTYPGPRPQSRETALVMLADGSEARIRADPPKTVEELREVIKSILDSRLSEEQLDATRITTRDLRLILDSFTASLRGVYHPRIKYPSLDQPTVPAGGSEMDQTPAAADTVPRVDTSTSAS
jgi:putative nucleotidyltransferase with HDIG domain